MQMVHKLPEGSGADSRQGSGGFQQTRFRQFRRVLAQKTDEVPKVPVQMADEVPKGSGADS